MICVVLILHSRRNCKVKGGCIPSRTLVSVIRVINNDDISKCSGLAMCLRILSRISFIVDIVSTEHCVYTKPNPALDNLHNLSQILCHVTFSLTV